MKYTLTKTFRFESAHRLAKGYKGKCANIHGHSWNGEIAVECMSLDSQDMGVDFTILKDFCKLIEGKFDHKIILYKHDQAIIDLCEANKWAYELTKENPTCETLANYIFGLAVNYFASDPTIIVKHITIKETCTTSCTYGHETK